MRGSLRSTALLTGRRVYTASYEKNGGKSVRPLISNANFSGTSRRGNNRVYVGNLKYEVTWQDLKGHMEQAGRVIKADIMIDATGRSKGCGIVEFETYGGAQDAIAKLSNTELDGRLVFVREDREKRSDVVIDRVPLRSVSEQGFKKRPNVDLHSEQPRPSRSVYVGNLSWDVNWQDLKDHMRSLGGLVEHADVLLEADGRSKGCGLVTFATVYDAEAAIAQLNDTELKGRPIFVREDREAGHARLYVGNLDYRTEWYELKDHFKSVGTVTRADLVREEGTDRNKGYGFVEFASAEDALEAVNRLNNSQLLGRTIHVREDREEKKRY